MDNAGIFPQLLSKSRGLAKISEKTLQPLLVKEIVDQSYILVPYYIAKGEEGAWRFK